MKTCLIYKITNPNGKSYIGQSKNWDKRYKKYKALNCKEQPAIYRSFLKYGFDNHTFEILMQNIPTEILSDLERMWIYLEDTFHNGLNCTEGGEGGSGPKSLETREKISKSKKGKENGRIGTHFSDISKKKSRLSQPHRNIVLCVETNQIFNSCHEACNLLKIPKTSLFHHLNGKMKNVKGYHFKYEN